MDPYVRIRNDIIRCTLAPGEIVNESDLAARYGVGRTAVREALQALRHDGLVESMPRVGYIISQVSVKDVVDLFAVREIVEPAITGLAAENASEAEIEKIQALANEHLQLTGRDAYRQFYRKNSEFHHLIARSSHNQILASFELDLLGRMERLFNLRPIDVGGTADRVSADHQALAEAIASHDPAKAREISLAQIRLSRQRILEAVFGEELSSLSIGPSTGGPT